MEIASHFTNGLLSTPGEPNLGGSSETQIKKPFLFHAIMILLTNCFRFRLNLYFYAFQIRSKQSPFYFLSTKWIYLVGIVCACVCIKHRNNKNITFFGLHAQKLGFGQKAVIAQNRFCAMRPNIKLQNIPNVDPSSKEMNRN